MESDKPKQNRNRNFNYKRQPRSFIPMFYKKNNTVSEQENRNNEAKQSGEKKRRFWKLYPEEWVAVGTIALFIATAVLALYTYKLFDEASHSTELAAQTHTNDSANAVNRFKSDSTLAYIRFQNETATINKQIALADKGLQQQIQSLKDAQNPFKQQKQTLSFCFGFSNIPCRRKQIPYCDF